MSWLSIVKSVVEGCMPVLTKEEVRELGRSITAMLLWCSRPGAIEGVCTRFFSIVKELITVLHNSRVPWHGAEGEGVDASFLKRVSEIIREYYEALLTSISDSERNVYIEIVRSFEYKGKKYPRGYNTFIPLEDAVLLSSLGLVRVLRIPGLLEKIRL
ncbi:MAG: hypothetical protein DRO39_00165 [Thermoprotei archaeon]|nr:MAG: hypothetical protein DRO39_00165 [Thermoprotei archaeon]